MVTLSLPWWELVLLNFGVGYFAYRHRAAEALVDGRPEVLIHNGHLYTSVMKRAKLTHHELSAALRQAGVLSIEEVHTAILENNGAITVTPKSRRNHEVGS